jgi:hypothetical protein
MVVKMVKVFESQIDTDDADFADENRHTVVATVSKPDRSQSTCQV